MLVARKKHLPCEEDCMQQILHFGLPDCQFALIIPLFFLMQPEISQSLFLTYLDRMIEQKNIVPSQKCSTCRAFQRLTSDKPNHTTTIDTQQSA